MKALICSLICAATTSSALAADPQVPYPQGYRDGHHVKSIVIEEGHPLFASFGGIHHLYANDRAVKDYRGNYFPGGSVIIFDLLEAMHDGNAVTEGACKMVGVMHKELNKYQATGGWGCEGFGGGDPAKRVVSGNAASACFACHQPQKAQDYTFSRLRD
jgi:hypothetical protein